MRKAFSVAIIALAAIPATAHAVHSQRAESRAKRDLEAMTSAVLPFVPEDGEVAGANGVRDVTLNGARIFFKQASENKPIDDVLKGIAKECESPDQTVALGISGNDRENETKQIKLERVVVQETPEAPNVKASLCIFAAEANVGGEEGSNHEPLRRVRYTLAHQRDDGTTRVTTISTACSTPLSEIFPAVGDAPGSDLTEVARPEAARRPLTAMVGSKQKNAVRVYESDLPTEKSISSYDSAMGTKGFQTTASLPLGRMYRKDGHGFVVSFQGKTGGSTVTISQFD